MGWMFGWNERKSLVEHLTQFQKSDDGKRTQETIRKKFSGNNLWCVFEHKNEGQEPQRFIVVFLMRGYPVKGGSRGEREWGYKDVSEDMGPCEISCPISFFDIVPDPGGYATEWRKHVREAHATRYQKLVVGQKVQLTNGKDYTISKLKGRRVVGTDDLGNEWLIPRKMLTLQKAQEAANV